MIKIKYDRYVNDYNWKQGLEKTFLDLNELRDWMFENARNYKKDVRIPDPDLPKRNSYWKESEMPWRIEIRRNDGEYEHWIKLIEDERGIIFSSGEHTNGQRFWNNKAKEFCRETIEIAKKPKFNFSIDVEKEISHELTETEIKNTLEYLRSEFPKPMSNSFTYELVHNVLMQKSKENISIYDHIADIIPEVDAEELEYANKIRQTVSTDDRLILLYEGDEMDATAILFSTNAPEEYLRKLELDTLALYKQEKDIPIWMDVVSEAGYTFSYVSEVDRINSANFEEWKDEHCSDVNEIYCVGVLELPKQNYEKEEELEMEM